jgi:hypothetical protein
MGQQHNEQKLEFFDRTGIIKPVVRLRRQKKENNFPKYEMTVTDIFTLKEYYYKTGSLELYNEYEPWSNYRDEFEENTILFYHPFQFLPMRRLTMGLSFYFGAESLERLQNIEQSFQRAIYSVRGIGIQGLSYRIITSNNENDTTPDRVFGIIEKIGNEPFLRDMLGGLESLYSMISENVRSFRNLIGRVTEAIDLNTSFK